MTKIVRPAHWLWAGLLLALTALLPVSVVHAGAPDYTLVSISVLAADGGRVEWSADGEWIYTDHREADGFWDVYRMRPDGSERECLTCDHPDLPNLHQGQPFAHPDGRYLGFQVEDPSHPLADSYHEPAEPGLGTWSNLWVMDLTDRSVTQLNQYVGWGLFQVGGSLHAHFSPDGTKLAWGDLQTSLKAFGDYRIAVADFIPTPEPRLEKIVYYEPGPVSRRFVELGGWAPDGSGLYVTCNCIANQDEANLDVGFFELATNSWTRLTPTSGLDGEPGQWDEFGHINPAFGDAILWMSSMPYGTIEGNTTLGSMLSWLKTDYWIMDPDGSNQRQITFFNVPGHPHYIPAGVIASDFAWSPDGLKVAGLVGVKGIYPPEHILILEFVRGENAVAMSGAWELPQVGTGSLRGRMGDSATGKVLSGVRVELLETGQSVTTNNLGRYALSGVPAGTVTVRASRSGYLPQSRTVTLVTGQEVNVSFNLVAEAPAAQ